MHLESVGVRTLWRTLIAFAFVQDGLEGKGPILCSRVGETGVSTRVVGDKGSNIPEIATDSVALDGFSFLPAKAAITIMRVLWLTFSDL